MSKNSTFVDRILDYIPPISRFNDYDLKFKQGHPAKNNTQPLRIFHSCTILIPKKRTKLFNNLNRTYIKVIIISIMKVYTHTLYFFIIKKFIFSCDSLPYNLLLLVSFFSVFTINMFIFGQHTNAHCKVE